jgi:hypothetical protein
VWNLGAIHIVVHHSGVAGIPPTAYESDLVHGSKYIPIDDVARKLRTFAR